MLDVVSHVLHVCNTYYVKRCNGLKVIFTGKSHHKVATVTSVTPIPYLYKLYR